MGTLCRVVLTGFMGAGKSTVGRLLTQKIGWDFLDIDNQIETSGDATAKVLFALLGEVAFRKLESDTLAFCLRRSKAVIAVGGAAIDMPTNQRLLAKAPGTLVAFFDAPFATLIKRCLVQERSGGAIYRPLLHKTEVARARFSARRSLYAAYAHLKVDVTERTPDEVTLIICDTMARRRQSSRGLRD
jgi:shikimate kinase